MSRNIIMKSMKHLLVVFVVLVLVVQSSFVAKADTAMSFSSTYMVSSYSAPQRFSVQVTGRTIDFNMFDETSSNNLRTLIIFRDSANNDLKRGEEYFTNNNCYISMDVPACADGKYYLYVWQHQPSGNYVYYTNVEIRISSGKLLLYSVNGQGQQNFINNANANNNPTNYTGLSYWAQQTENYDEIASMARRITAGCNNDEEKVRAIHDWLCNNLSYDYESYYKGDSSNAASASWVYANKRGVCSGFSRLANVMLTAVGVPKMNIQGRAFIEEGVDYDVNHEWNLVYYNDSWHIFDFTHDCKNAFYGNGDRRNVTGQAPIYYNYDMSAFSSGTKYISINNVEQYNNDGYGKVAYRLYNMNSGEHFYTQDYNETMYLISLGWSYEGESWKSPLRSSTPVYRLYNPNSGEHHYTINSYEKDYLSYVGWNYEGIAWYSDDKSRVAIYRLYNPNASGTGAHHYTTNGAERDMLIWCGWNYEGVGWYGV